MTAFPVDLVSLGMGCSQFEGFLAVSEKVTLRHWSDGKIADQSDHEQAGH
jgi:hypothetical protein